MMREGRMELELSLTSNPPRLSITKVELAAQVLGHRKEIVEAQDEADNMHTATLRWEVYESHCR
jgi:hypothetical protein